MRIAISVENNQGLDSTVAHHFGRCPYFAFVDVVGREIEALEVFENPHYISHQPGQVPSFIKDHKADVMLGGGMGGRAIQFFQQYDIDTATGATGTIKLALESYLDGNQMARYLARKVWNTGTGSLF